MKTKNLFFALSIIFLPLFSFSETEPNNDPANASLLGVNASDAGTLTATTDIDDWWKITIPADGKLVVNTTSDETLEIDLLLFDINGTTQIASYDKGWGIYEATHYNNLIAGTYYVKAYCWGSGYGSYSISSIFTPTGFTNDTESNDSVQMAITLPLTGSSTGHLGFYSNGYMDLYDWYKITIPADGKLVVNTTSDTTLEIDLFLYDINGTTQIASYDTAWGIREGTHYNNLMPGTYYVKAYCWGSKYGSYTISSIFTPTELINDTENNDSFPLAVNLPLNGNSSGHLGFYSNGYTDVYDWWKIIIPADGSLIVNTTSDKTLEIDLFMYSTDGTTQIASSDTSWGIHEATHYNSLIPGTYYVNAFSWGSGYGSYTISSLFSPQTGITNTLIPPDEVSVFPNPTFDKVTISSLGKITAIEIYNMLGEKVYAINNFKQQTSNGIDFSDFQKGIYFLKIYSGQKIQTKKIVLQ